MVRRIALAVLIAVSAAAQWIDHPTPGIPRLANGKPNLSAPVPKTAGGKPDLSGLWQRARGTGRPTQRTNNAGLAMGPNLADFMRPGDSIPDQMLIGVPLKIVQNPGLTLILYEEFARFRQVFTDGRDFPPVSNPAWLGYSIGHWDGDWFVVDTRGFNDKSWLDDSGRPHTEALHTVERFRRRDFGHMDIEVTIDDPQAYTKPWSFPMQFEFLADTEMIEDVCDNEKDYAHAVGK
jgi:hypothetical protein